MQLLCVYGCSGDDMRLAATALQKIARIKLQIANDVRCMARLHSCDCASVLPCNQLAVWLTSYCVWRCAHMTCSTKSVSHTLPTID